MAEKKSINIGGDASIIGAAGNLARSQQPFSMKGMADDFIKNRGEILETQSDRFVANQKAIEAMNDEVKKSIKDLETQINDGTIDVQAERDIAQGKIDAWREQLKDIPRGKAGKAARDAILYKVNKYTKGRQKTSEAGATVINTITTENYDVSQLEPGQLALIGHFSEVSKNPKYTADSFSKEKNEDGNYVYTHTYTDAGGVEQVIEGDIFDIQELLAGAAPQGEFVESVQKYIYDKRADAVANPDQDFSVVRDSIKSRLNNDFNTNHAGFRATIGKDIGLSGKSYIEALNDEASDEYQGIIDALIGLNPSEFDFNGDNTVDAADFENATTENINEMIRALTRPKPGEKVVAHELAAIFYADGEAKKAYGIGEAEVAKTKADAIALTNQKAYNANYNARIKAEAAERDRLQKLQGQYGFGPGMNSLNISDNKNLKTFKFGTAGEEGSTSTNYTGNDLEMALHKFMSLEESGKGSWGTHQNGNSYKYDNGQWLRLGSDDDSGEFKRTTRKTVMNEMLLLGNVIAVDMLGGGPAALEVYEYHKTLTNSDGSAKVVPLYNKQVYDEDGGIISLKTGIDYGNVNDYVRMDETLYRGSGKNRVPYISKGTGNWAKKSDPNTPVIWELKTSKDDKTSWASSFNIKDTQLIAHLLEQSDPLNPR